MVIDCVFWGSRRLGVVGGDGVVGRNGVAALGGCPSKLIFRGMSLSGLDHQ